MKMLLLISFLLSTGYSMAKDVRVFNKNFHKNLYVTFFHSEGRKTNTLEKAVIPGNSEKVLTIPDGTDTIKIDDGIKNHILLFNPASELHIGFYTND